MEKELNLSHTILYAKGWYARSEEQWKDLVKTIDKDGYFISESEREVAAFLLNYISGRYDFIKKYYNCLSIVHFFEEVAKRKGWCSCGEETAIIKVCLHIFGVLPKEAFKMIEADENVLALSENAINFKQEKIC